ncbi:MAG: hypothetical protein HIU82_05520 [Proteobacteria bacterium]|nr:hypothetical protein [Pseudomonadota bacterium]
MTYHKWKGGAVGTNVVVYRPSLLPPVVQGDHFDYRWTGAAAPLVVKLTGVGGPTRRPDGVPQ